MTTTTELRPSTITFVRRTLERIAYHQDMADAAHRAAVATWLDDAGEDERRHDAYAEELRDELIHEADRLHLMIDDLLHLAGRGI